MSKRKRLLAVVLAAAAVACMVAFGQQATYFYKVMVGAGGIVFEGATTDSYELTLTVTDPTADRTVTIPKPAQSSKVALSAAVNTQGVMAWHYGASTGTTICTNIGLSCQYTYSVTGTSRGCSDETSEVKYALCY